MSNTWEHFDALIRQATGSMQQSFEEGAISETEYKLYIEDTRRLQKQVKGDDYNADEDDKNIGY